MTISNYLLGTSGEHRVCAELQRRGLSASITLGNAKSADLVVFGANKRVVIIEVKTSQTGKFLTKYYQHEKPEGDRPDFWVFYNMGLTTTGEFVDQFFILTDEEVAEVQALANNISPIVPYSARFVQGKGGTDGFKMDAVVAYEDRWDKIVNHCQ